ncbi:hypothetical protein HK099_000379 [Clydaea vesicula]|uniref:Uncharacterized protein n=1 Tax=Clydaea vesicula TaxID=447962 RepID=A0AAD5XXF5_9FUNG|nr:hypothetical protein HK099_000379 [Clydaea vesicula]
MKQYNAEAVNTMFKGNMDAYKSLKENKNTKWEAQKLITYPGRTFSGRDERTLLGEFNVNNPISVSQKLIAYK